MLFWGKKKKMLPDIIVGFVLLEGFDYNFNKLKLNLKNEWGIEIKDSAEEDTIAFNVDDMLIACSFVPEPIPDHEVEVITRITGCGRMQRKKYQNIDLM